MNLSDFSKISSVWLYRVDTSEPAGNSDTQTKQASDPTDSQTRNNHLEIGGGVSAGHENTVTDLNSDYYFINYFLGNFLLIFDRM